MGRYFLGVDGGQSSTTALIGGPSGCVLGFGRGGPCNHVGSEAGRRRFITAITACIGAACGNAGLDFASIRFEAACLGFSGGPADKQALLHDILRCDRMQVTHDAAVALEGATAGEPGVIVIAGTGSIAFGRNAAARTARAGGWGYIFGDEGGGFDIARQGLRAVLRRHEGWGPATKLEPMLLEATGSADANEMLHRFYTSEYPRERVARLALLVDRAASDEDAVAQHIMEMAGEDLAALARAVVQQLFGPGEAAVVSYVGGVFRSARVLNTFRRRVNGEASVSITPPAYGPAAGALIAAYRDAGVPATLSGVPEIEKQ